MDVAEEERKRFEEKYGVAPKGKTLVGFKSRKAIWSDEEDEDDDSIPTNSIANPALDKNLIEGRQGLAGRLKEFALTGGMNRPDGEEARNKILDEAEIMGVSRSQLSDLYKKYRSEQNEVYKSQMAKKEQEERAKEWNANFNRPTPMQASRKMVGSPEVEIKGILRKAMNMGINPNQLIASKEGNLFAAIDALKAAGIYHGGLKTAEESEAHRAITAQERRKQRELENAQLKILKKKFSVDEGEDEDEDEDEA
jgi:hypothetical protein